MTVSEDVPLPLYTDYSKFCGLIYLYFYEESVSFIKEDLYPLLNTVPSRLKGGSINSSDRSVDIPCENPSLKLIRDTHFHTDGAFCQWLAIPVSKYAKIDAGL